MDSFKKILDDIDEINKDGEKIQIESHTFICRRFINTPDIGFSPLLIELLTGIENSDKVLDEDLKAVARGMLLNVIGHRIIKHTKKTKDEIQNEEEKKKKDELNFIV
jgi:hypothetical protein